MAQKSAWRRLPRFARIALISLGALVLLVVVGVGVLFATFDPESLKPRLVAAVKQETGRDLTLNGPIGLKVSLWPTVALRDVSLANPPGFSRPQMASLNQLEIQLAVLPLLSGRVEVGQLVLISPDILLETNKSGQSNWEFERPASTQPAAAAPSQPTSSETRSNVFIQAVRIDNGTLGLLDDRTGNRTTLGLTQLRANTASPDSPIHVSMDGTYNGAATAIEADTGSLVRLLDRNADTAWPVKLSFTSGAAKLAADGSFTRPLQGGGYTLKLDGSVPDLTALAAFVPGQKLPPVRDIKLSAQVADKNGPIPEISALTLRVGESDLGTFAPGLKLTKLDVQAPRLDQPGEASAQGSFASAPLSVSAKFGALSALLTPQGKPSGSLPVDGTVQAAGTTVSLNGSLGYDVQRRPFIQGVLKSDKVDADALLAAFGKPQAAPGSNGAPPAPASPPAPKSNRLIPDTPIPFGSLRLADADVSLSVNELKTGGALYRAITGHVVLNGGRLVVDPFAADLPEGHLQGALTADATQAAPQVQARLHAPGLAVAPLLAAAGMPGYASGNLEVYADLRGAGETPHAIASVLDGSLGLAMVNGTVDNRLLGSTLGFILREINLLDLVGRGGASQVQCFAARLDASHGVATFRTLLLSSSLLTMEGGGSINLGSETLSMQVRAEGRVAGTGVVVPLRVSGPIRSPSATPDPAAAVTANAGTVAGAVIGGATPLGLLGSALGAQKLLGGGSASDGCGAALAIARGGSAPAAPARQASQTPAPAPSQPAQQQPKLPNPGNLLHQLFR